MVGTTKRVEAVKALTKADMRFVATTSITGTTLDLRPTVHLSTVFYTMLE
jgi:hypothetical protein